MPSPYLLSLSLRELHLQPLPIVAAAKAQNYVYAAHVRNFVVGERKQFIQLSSTKYQDHLVWWNSFLVL